MVSLYRKHLVVYIYRQPLVPCWRLTEAYAIVIHVLRLGLMGPLTGGGGVHMSRVDFFKRNAYVACLCRLCMPMSDVEFKKWPCRISNLRNIHVALSILGV